MLGEIGDELPGLLGISEMVMRERGAHVNYGGKHAEVNREAQFT